MVATGPEVGAAALGVVGAVDGVGAGDVLVGIGVGVAAVGAGAVGVGDLDGVGVGEDGASPGARSGPGHPTTMILGSTPMMRHRTCSTHIRANATKLSYVGIGLSRMLSINRVVPT